MLLKKWFGNYFICLSVFTALLLSIQTAKAQNEKYKLSGRVFEKGKRIPLSNISVFVLPEKIQILTNEQGEFFTDLIMQKESQIIVSAAGFERWESAIDFSESSEVSRTIFLKRDQQNQNLELVVIDPSLKRDQSRKSLSRQEIFNAPGANGDPVKAVQNFPGINRTQGFSSQIVIQGSAPKDTAYDFEGHEIPLVFHFGGLSSVVMPEAVEQVEYFSAGYQADRSRALGGIISLRTRNPDVIERKSKGLFYLDNLSAGGLYESRIDESSSYLISGRYSYVGLFLKSAFKDNEALNLTVAPEFVDLTGVYNKKISESEELKVSLLASKDRLAFVFTEPVRAEPSARGKFSNQVQFFRLVPQWKKQLDLDTKITASVAIGQDQISVDFSDRFFDLKSNVLSTRAEWDRQFSNAWALQMGWDNQYSQARVKLKLPLRREQGGITNPISSSQLFDADVNAKINNLGLYIRSEHQLSQKLKVTPSLRFDRFSQTKEMFLLPRFAWKYSFTDYEILKFGYGLYVQNPEPQESSTEVGNPDIRSPRAVQVGITYEKDFRQGDVNGFTTSIGGFFREFDKLVIQSSKQVLRNGQTVFEIYNNEGKGKAFGIESLIKYKRDQWQGQMSYTLSKSRRKDGTGEEYNFEFDQTHNLNLIGSYEFVSNWKISSRYRYVTGNPDTPVVGSIYDSDNETFYPVRGPIYSTRNNPFSQLDFRIDRKFVLDTEIWTFYLDIQNVINSKNPEGVQYSYDYSSKQEVMGLPLIPALGIRGEF